MISTEMVRAMDTADEQELSVAISRDMVVLCDSTQFPYKRIYLTATEARKLAGFLTEQADIADDLAPVDVEMVCTVCRKEVKRFETGAWHHVTWNQCSAAPVKAMVGTNA